MNATGIIFMHMEGQLSPGDLCKLNHDEAKELATTIESQLSLVPQGAIFGDPERTKLVHFHTYKGLLELVIHLKKCGYPDVEELAQGIGRAYASVLEKAFKDIQGAP